jgi:hypothetical protein
VTIMHALAQHLSDLGIAARQWFDTVPLDSLFLMALAFRMGARCFRLYDLQIVAYMVASLFFVTYFMHLYAINGNGFGYVLASLLRSLFAYHVVWSVTMIAVALVNLARWLLHDLRLIVRQTLPRWQSRLLRIGPRIQDWWRRRHPLPLPPPRPLPRPVPRAVALRQFAQAAEADYDAEVAALEGLPLDEDEREVLLCAAKQRLLRKLNREE